MLYELYRFNSGAISLSLWEDEQLKKWAAYNLFLGPDDIFTIIDEGKPTDHSQSVKVYRFRDGATGWASLVWIVQRSELLESENNI